MALFSVAVNSLRAKHLTEVQKALLSNLVDHVSSSSDRSLRAALCFSSKRSFSALASSERDPKTYLDKGMWSRDLPLCLWLVAATHVSVLHGSDVWPQPTVCWGQKLLHPRLQLIQRHSKAGEVVDLGNGYTEKLWTRLCVCLQALRLVSSKSSIQINKVTDLSSGWKNKL